MHSPTPPSRWLRAAVGVFFTTIVGCVVFQAQKQAEPPQPSEEASEPEATEDASIEEVEAPPSEDSGSPVFLPSSKVGPLYFDSPPVDLEEVFEDLEPTPETPEEDKDDAAPEEE
jgi:hypothetical protein